ncbi:MAG: glyoxalase [Acidobacteria bacterium]|nr:MAG: glyoxalase [Acidobacteriota bacterium]
MAPMANGKICYVEIPATDIAVSARFYENVFGWNIRQRGDGARAFDDAVGEVSGTWVLNRPPATEPGLLLYIMVKSISAACDAVIRNGCDVLERSSESAPVVIARFRDPAGNVIGLYQERSLSESGNG